MIRIELNAHEAAILHRVLLSYLEELKSEIARTDLAGFNDLLLEEQACLKELIGRLEMVRLLPEEGTGDYVG